MALPPPDSLRWLPDETLFSLCSRHHRLSAQSRASHTSRALFGHPRGGLAHDLPDRIDALAERTCGALGPDAQSIIRRHTILTFYLPFRPSADADAAIAGLRGPGIGSLKFRLGMLTSRFRAHHPLKSCPRCAAGDVEANHVAYWHLAHQYPGVWICLTHDVPLLESTMKSTGVGRFQWLLPADATHVSPIRNADEADEEHDLKRLLRGFALAASALAAMPDGFHFDPHRLVGVHAMQLVRRGFTKPSGRIESHAGASLARFLMPLERVPELAALAIPPHKASAQLVHLRDPLRARTHPLRHIAQVLWLYGSWDEFVGCYAQSSGGRSDATVIASTPPPAAARTGADPRLAQFLELVASRRLAVTGAARQVGIDPKTGMAWAARAGIVCSRRPKKLTLELRTKMVAELRRGVAKRVIADQYGVSIETVTDTLRTEVGLHDAWALAQVEARRTQERRAWLKLGRRNAYCGSSALRLLAPATYAWLYRNDRAWLQAQTAVRPCKPRSNNAAVDWQDRDAQLCMAVLQACLEIANEAPGRRITLWRIYQRIPGIRPKLRYLDRLPLTLAAIERAVGRTKVAGDSGPLF